MRPVPVVFLRLAFSPQLTAFLLIRCPERDIVVAFSGHTLAGLSSGVAARGTGVLLDVEGAATCPSSSQPIAFENHKSTPQISLDQTFRRVSSAYAVWMPSVEERIERSLDVPQRLHSVCVLLWRLPKLEVPFAVLAVSYP